MAESREIGLRALGLMQALAGSFARGEEPAEGPQRNIVSKQVALAPLAGAPTRGG